MSVRPPWSYVQARLQSRHGERLQEDGWRVIEAARSLDQFIERSRTTSLRRFSERLNAGMSSHTIERTLRTAWHDYVAEIAAWASPDWRPAVLWASHVADLPAIDALLRGERPEWASQDTALVAFLQSERSALEKSPLAPLLPAPGREASLARRWFAHWRALWPRGDGRQALDSLADTIKVHFESLSRAGLQETSRGYRRALAHNVTRLFRRHGGSPTAMFCHLVLVALDLERLRGGLAHRRLFPAVTAKEAA
jgi:lambda repressor-like predicted transcriptional regulator